MNAQDKPAAFASLEDKAKALCDSPVTFFGQSYTAMHTLPRAELDALQLAGLQYRFNSLRDRIAVLKKLADNQGIERLETLEDAVPLLFEHTMYKSYPPSLLENGRFTEINKFLSRLCAHDVSGIDVSKCETIDDWMELMDAESPLSIVHSSGSSGVMSFLPLSKHEQDKHGQQLRVTGLQNFGQDPAEAYKDEIYAIYPFFRKGGSGHIRLCDSFVKYIAGSEDRVFTAYPGRMSSDLLYLAARIRAAQAKGELGRLKISPAMLARKAEYEKLQADMPEHMMKFFGEVIEKLRGKRIFFWAAQNLLYNLLQIGLQQDLHKVFAPNSVVGAGGDTKEGLKMPDNWQAQVCDFMGVDRIKICYGMTEVRAMHNKCEHGHYHIAPWVIVYALDPDTGKMMPRKGVTTGRASFFDLGAETRWGGCITGDEITVHWDEDCPCGQTTVWLEDGIQRYSVKRGGDDKISCSATEGAHREAMSFLTNLEL